MKGREDIKDFYKRSDTAIRFLKRKAAERFETALKQARKAGYNPQAVDSIVKQLYTDLEADNRGKFLELAQKQYDTAVIETEEKTGRVLDLVWLLLLLGQSGETTRYVYQNEVLRKRDRMIEAINAATDRKAEFDAALSYWERMTRQYCDVVTDAATVEAYEDAGIERVKWISVEDDKTCRVCNDRNGKIYKVNEIPAKAHWGCRCYFEPVKND